MDPRRPSSRLIDAALSYGPGVAIALALAGYQLAQPSFIDGVHGIANAGYDDGVYLGAVSNFVHGVVPYRDFTFLQPPGVVVLLAPLGLLGRLIGTAYELEVARVLVLVASVVNVGLAASLARSRGRAAAALAGVLLACYPLASAATNTLNLEPLLVLLMLVGTRLAFEGGVMLAGRRRLLIAGIVFGFAADVKVWGIAACVGFLIVTGIGRRLRRALTGVVAGIVVSSLPFVVLAPSATLHDTLIAQFDRKDVLDAWSIPHRLALMFGLDSQSDLTWHTTAAVLLGVIVCIVVVAAIATERSLLEPVAWFLLATSVLLIGGLLAARQFYDHYGYAVAAVVAPLLGLCVPIVLRLGPEARPSDAWRRRAFAVVAAIAAAIGALGVPASISRTSRLLADDFTPSPAIAAIVPKGACAITDVPTLLVLANRWDTDRRCRRIVDPFGEFVSTTKQPPPGQQPFPASLTTPWHAALVDADYIVLAVAGSDYVPWTYGIRQAYDTGFVVLSNDPGAVIAASRR